MRRFAGLLVLLGIPMGVVAQNPPALPDLSPDLLVVTGFNAEQGMVSLRMTQFREHEQQSTRQLPNGAAVVETRKVVVPCVVYRRLILKQCKVLEASGKAIAAEDLAKRLPAGVSVVVSNDGNPPAQAFLQILRPDTVIIVEPPRKPNPWIERPPEPLPPPKERKMPEGK